MKNIISITAHLVNDTQSPLFHNGNPEEIIKHIAPDTGAPVQSLEIWGIDSNGRKFSLSIGKRGCTLRVDSEVDSFE